ncbi:lysophosphatidic acid receptor [Nitrosomonas sp.]|uniref:lysophosphatidic acid receptor n=1 Tax=Nitrosomonas sp. TaxID=42353 RepID=UPI001D5625DE|nr:lysophosphatidic acid receptor [Nitrosomonas sp.]MBX3616288.1 lysophosphatidic acid receptor [Nitrosomonas sp.]
MQNELDQRTTGKNLLIWISALGGGFLLSFLGFGLLWSGISWAVQMVLALLFFTALSYGLSYWSSGAVLPAMLLVIGAMPLGLLMMQFRDTSGSHLLPILVVLSWLFGMLAGYFWGKWARRAQIAASQERASS